MSSLIVVSDLDLMMVEIAIEQLVVPRGRKFDEAVLKKTVAMFRLLDRDWTSIYPQRTDYHVYRGTNLETEPFNGGVSVLFPIPESSLEQEVDKIDLQLYVRRELSKYFEHRSSEVVGIAIIDVSDLFNGVIDTLKKNKGDQPSRVPIAKSSKRTYPLLNEHGIESGAEATVYLRLSHLGNSLISEIEVPDDPRTLFYAREETSHSLPYQFKEITFDELTSGCWGSDTLLPPRNPKDTTCCCSSGSKDHDVAPKSGISEIADSKKSKEPSDDLGQSDQRPEKGEQGGKKSSEKGGAKPSVEKSKGAKNEDTNGGLKTEKVDENVTENKTKNKNGKGNGNGNGNRGETAVSDADRDQGTVSCQIKPSLCGREGTCRKKDKRGKFGKCGKPDGEGGNPLGCGEQRKCARRRLASGSATVGIVDKKKVPDCPRPPNVCRCPATIRACPTWSMPCPTTALPSAAPTTRCQSLNYYTSAANGGQNFCLQNYDPQRFIYLGNQPCGRIAGGRSMPTGWVN